MIIIKRNLIFTHKQYFVAIHNTYNRDMVSLDNFFATFSVLHLWGEGGGGLFISFHF